MISSALLCLQNSLRVRDMCAKILLVSHFAINPRCGLLRIIIIDKLINNNDKLIPQSFKNQTQDPHSGRSKQYPSRKPSGHLYEAFDKRGNAARNGSAPMHAEFCSRFKPLSLAS